LITKARRTRKPRPRSEVPVEDRWDLSSLFSSDEEWKQAMGRFERRIGRLPKFEGTLGDSAKALASALDFETKLDREGERVGAYAFLRYAEDVGDPAAQTMYARYRNAASRAARAASYLRPEILAIPARRMKTFLDDPALRRFRLHLERILRTKGHTLSPAEERLIALQGPVAQTPSRVFSQLNDNELRFGTVRDERGTTLELSHGTFARLLRSPKRSVRREAFQRYYRAYEGHKNTLAATLEGSIQRDVFLARARGFDSSLHAALFPDGIPVTVYDNLIESVHRILPDLYRYFDLRRRKLRLRDIHHYDTYVPIVREGGRRRSWDQAVRAVVDALEPLGSEYTSTLARGLEGGWCDRYENLGKQSGAFSCGSYDGDPYILMNYQPEVLDDLFTLAHEAGHSMHSHLSSKKQPYLYYNYTIFVAEVASTFNEQLLGRHLLETARDDRERALVLNHEIDSIRATLIRQTMFAEFERITHEIAERDEPLTVERFRTEYRKLLELYFGPEFEIDPELSLECLRIPHFYRAFYVYQYATGISAAMALAERVLAGGREELGPYLGLLRGGCSEFPLDLLRKAGADLARPDVVDAALQRFGELVGKLESLI